MMDMNVKTKALNVPLFTSFYRYVLSAGTATTCDFSVLFLLTEIFDVYYVVSAFFGASSGATVAFLLGRNWTFLNKEGKISHQGLKFLMVVLGSIGLNTFGVYFFTEVIMLPHYAVSKIVVAVMVGIFYNFTMQRYFVFR